VRELKARDRDGKEDKKNGKKRMKRNGKEKRRYSERLEVLRYYFKMLLSPLFTSTQKGTKTELHFNKTQMLQ